MGKQIASVGTTLHGTKITAEMNHMIMLVDLFSAIYNEGWQRDRTMVDLDLARFKQYVWQRIVACQESGNVFSQKKKNRINIILIHDLRESCYLVAVV